MCQLLILLLIVTTFCLINATPLSASPDAIIVPSTTSPPSLLTQLLHGFPIAVGKGLKGGKAGALAGLLQVITLMWLRTVVNYQYRYQVTMNEGIFLFCVLLFFKLLIHNIYCTVCTVAFRELYADGGVLRFYKGIIFAVRQPKSHEPFPVSAIELYIIFRFSKALFLSSEPLLPTSGRPRSCVRRQ